MLTIFHNKRDFAEQDCKTAVLPVGAIEQHGSHLPVGTDTLIVDEFARRIAEKVGAYLLPAISIASSIEHRKAKGTVYLKADTLALVIRDIAESLQYSGFEKLLIVNAHGGNWIIKPTLRQLNRDFADRNEKMELVLLNSSLVVRRQGEVLKHEQHDLHGGEKETSLMLYLYKEHVKPHAGQREVAKVPQDYMDYFDVTEITEDGYWGFPEEATVEKGQRVMELMVECAMDYLEKLEQFREHVAEKKK